MFDPAFRIGRRAKAAGALASLALLPAAAAGRDAPPGRVVKLITTGYCLGPCGPCETRGITYTGTRSARGVAVGALRSRRAFGLGNRLRIPGYGLARIDDVGGAVSGRQLDLRFPSHRQAAAWGRKTVPVLLLRRKPAPQTASASRTRSR